MPSILVSGPAGAGKTQVARELIAASLVPTIMLDFQTIYAGLLGIERDATTRRYAERQEEDAHALRLAEYGRRALITGALAQGLDIIATNSDGNLTRRQTLLSLLGSGATERVVDPGIEVIRARLTFNEELSEQCQEAMRRWFGDELREAAAVEVRASATELRAVLIQEGRQASGGRNESFAPNSIEWPANGILVRPAHRESTDARAIPKREADGRITISAPLTPALRAAWDAGRRYMSIEFHALQERKVASGAREVLRAMVVAGALVERPEYDTATAELRGATPRRKRYWR